MHGSLEANASLVGAVREAAERLTGVDIAVCVPAPYLAQVHQLLAGSRVALGGQNVSEHAMGAYTGEVCASMLVEFGCRYVIVGHSERRQHYGESDRQIAAKLVAARSVGVAPIFCVGETLAQREAGKTQEVVLGQLNVGVEVLGAANFREVIVAYEPVWAIGTGRNATPEQAQEVHRAIRARIGEHGIDAQSLAVIYGGSVKAGNAAALFAMPDIDGGLIGGASLVAADFVAICAAAAGAK
jgi:triosephosphate isomerase